MTTGHSGHWECLQARWGDLPVRFSQQKKSCVFVVDWFPNRISRMPILSPNVLHSEASSLSCYLTVCSHDFFTVHTQWRRKRTSSLVCFPAQSLQSCPTLCEPVDHSPPGSSVHGILQARILECVAISFSRESSWPRDWTCISCIGSQILYHSKVREVVIAT